MRGLCIEGMENSVVKLAILYMYDHRQVIINIYDEDELSQRDGFYFEKVQLTEEMLTFIINEHNSFVIEIVESARLYKDNSFQNFFVLENGTRQIEIYFP